MEDGDEIADAAAIESANSAKVKKKSKTKNGKQNKKVKFADGEADSKESGKAATDADKKAPLAPCRYDPDCNDLDCWRPHSDLDSKGGMRHRSRVGRGEKPLKGPGSDGWKTGPSNSNRGWYQPSSNGYRSSGKGWGGNRGGFGRGGSFGRGRGRFGKGSGGFGRGYGGNRRFGGRGSGGRGGSWGASIQCHNCHEWGHISRDCTHAPKCYNCGSADHPVRFCPHSPGFGAGKGKGGRGKGKGYSNRHGKGGRPQHESGRVAETHENGGGTEAFPPGDDVGSNTDYYW